MVIKTINKAIGKESTKTTDFNQANWAITNGYLSSILLPSKFDNNINEAKSFLKATSQTGDSASFNTTSVEQDMDEQALFCDDDSD